jgi:4-hydroxybenzoate polyprenyltransferase
MLVWVVTLYLVGLVLALSVSVVSFFIAILIVALGISYSNPQIKLEDKFTLKTVVTAGGGALASFLGSNIISSSNL